jgi:hypothetical protein
VLPATDPAGVTALAANLAWEMISLLAVRRRNEQVEASSDITSYRT